MKKSNCGNEHNRLQTIWAKLTSRKKEFDSVEKQLSEFLEYDQLIESISENGSHCTGVYIAALNHDLPLSKISDEDYVGCVLEYRDNLLRAKNSACEMSVFLEMKIEDIVDKMEMLKKEKQVIYRCNTTLEEQDYC